MEALYVAVYLVATQKNNKQVNIEALYLAD